MGFERVTGIMQNTKRFRDFSRVISNYETDIFRPLFDELEKLSGKRYGSTLPAPGATQYTEQEKVDIAFRVIADHIRTLGFAIADGIRPGNNEREYVLRRILRRAVRYGRTLGFQQPFFYRLARVLASSMGAAFPELPARLELIEKTIRTEEEAFGKTLDAGLELFQSILRSQERWMQTAESLERELTALDWKAEPEKVGVVKWTQSVPNNLTSEKFQSIYPSGFTAALQEVVRTFDVKALREALTTVRREGRQLSGAAAFLLADTHGFPLDLTELMAREAGFQVDVAGFKVLMEEQKRRAQAEKKRQVISLSSVDTSVPTRFNGYEESAAAAEVLEVVAVNERTAIVVDASPFYAEMGGQVGDAGEVRSNGHRWHIVDTRRVSSTFVHILAEKDAPARETKVHLTVDRPRRAAIERHHTVTHLLHWALHEVVSRDAAQKGSFVGVDKLTFDFNSSPLTAKHLADVERLVNERILENAPVSWAEVPYGEVKERRDIMQFFGEKYGSKVRVVQIGGQPSQLNGFSMELCAGTHTRATGELGLFRIVGESATGAGVRRIEALAGLCAYDKTRREMELIATMAGRLNTPIGELEKRLESLLVQQKEMEKQLKSAQQREAADIARTLLSKARALGAVRLIVADLGTADGDYLQTVADALKGEFKGVVVLGGVAQGAVSLVATVSPEFVAGVQAGRIMQTIAAIVGGKGGGRPDNARGGGKDPSRLKAALDEVENLIPKP
jgi:alanyl-tRNA synthetase